MIKTVSRLLAILLFVLTIVVAVLLSSAWTLVPLEGVALTLHGQTFSLADLHGAQAILFFVLAVAGVVIAVVAALAMIAVGLAVGALGLALGVLTTIGSLALVAAPFALIGWLLWRLVRERPAAIATGP